jgi:hypothetical protein
VSINLIGRTPGVRSPRTRAAELHDLTHPMTYQTCWSSRVKQQPHHDLTCPTNPPNAVLLRVRSFPVSTQSRPDTSGARDLMWTQHPINKFISAAQRVTSRTLELT